MAYPKSRFLGEKSKGWIIFEGRVGEGYPRDLFNGEFMCSCNELDSLGKDQCFAEAGGNQKAFL